MIPSLPSFQIRYVPKYNLKVYVLVIMNLDKNDEERKNSQIKKEHLHSFQLTFEHVSYRN